MPERRNKPAEADNKMREASIGANLPAGWIEQQGLIDPSTLPEEEAESKDVQND